MEERKEERRQGGRKSRKIFEEIRAENSVSMKNMKLHIQVQQTHVGQRDPHRDRLQTISEDQGKSIFSVATEE